MSTLEMIEKDACYFDDWADGMTAHAVTEYARMEHGRNKDDDIWTAMEAGREAYYLHLGREHITTQVKGQLTFSGSE